MGFSPRQFVIMSRAPASVGSMEPLGRRTQVLENLAAMNTASDGANDGVLHGPGIVIELLASEDPVRQMLLSIDDEDIAWSVIMRMLRELPWKLLDPESGRELTGGS